MGLRYDIVDVFTDRAYAGNPLAVVHGGAELTAGQMQAVAAEFGLSETAFPLPPTAAGADYRLRIFTPVRELPFAGHPSVGAAWVLARDKAIGTGEVVQECGAGLLPVTVDPHGAQVTGGRPELGPELDGAALAAALGLTAADVDPAVPAGVAAAGVPFAFLAVRPDAVARAVPDPAALRERGVAGRPPSWSGWPCSPSTVRPGGCTCACSPRGWGWWRTRRPGRRRWRSACSSPAGGCWPPTGRPGSPCPRARSWAGRRCSGFWCTPRPVPRSGPRCTARWPRSPAAELITLPAEAG